MKKHARNPIVLYYCAHWFYIHRVPVLPSVLQALLFFACGANVSYRARIGCGCILGHGGNGIVVHEKARVGDRCVISQQVTIGGSKKSSSLPVIGADVYIGAGAKILGAVEIGNNSVIGANAVVVESIPPFCTAGGVPARILRRGIDGHLVEDW